MKNFWYNHFIAIPESRNTFEYNRIKRLWLDKTRFKGKKGTKNRKHELCDQKHETHLTATLWENFSLFNSSDWIHELLRQSDLADFNSKIVTFKWSYEWGYVKGSVHRIYDLILHYQLENGIKGVLIVEAKNLDKGISEKDTSPEYYLDIPTLNEFGINRQLIYCVDEKKKNQVKEQIKESKYSTGIITWQQLAGIQISYIDKLEADLRIKTFLKSAIYHQFINHGILSEIYPVDYLQSEPSMEEVDLEEEFNQTHKERLREIWRL